MRLFPSKTNHSTTDSDNQHQFDYRRAFKYLLAVGAVTLCVALLKSRREHIKPTTYSTASDTPHKPPRFSTMPRY